MSALVSGLLFLSAAIWIGGIVAVFVVVHAARTTLMASARVEFLRVLGRGYLRVLGTAGAVMVVLGGWQLRTYPLDAQLVALIVTTCALVGALAAGVVQARRMTRLRHRALDESGALHLLPAVTRGSRSAAVLRGVITVLSLAVVVQGGLLLSA